MHTFKYETGRRYDTEQVLVITHDDYSIDDETGHCCIPVKFVDASRGIAGTVNLVVWEGDRQRNIGAGVLAAYDRCQYELC